MGGADKPLLLHAGAPLVAHVARRLAPQVEACLVIANRSHEAYAALGVPVLADRAPGLGPLGGIATALAAATTPLLFACPGDAPCLAPGVVARLRAALGPQELAAYPHDGARAQPLFLLLRAAALPALEDYLARGGRAVHGFVAELRARAVDAPDLAASFRNINTPGELEALAREAP